MNRNFLFVLAFLLVVPLHFSVPTSGTAVGDGDEVLLSATQYYVDSVGGSDANPGTSPEAAFASLSKLAPLTLSPGDRVWLRRGSVFRDSRLAFGGNGTEAEPIVVDAYGEGVKPEILASSRPTTGWTLYSGECYKITVPPEVLVGDRAVNGVFHYALDNKSVPVRLAKEADIPTTRGAYFFSEATDTLYVITSDGRSPVDNQVEVSLITPLLDLYNRSWIEFRNLSFLFGGRRQWNFNNCSDVTMRDCAALFMGNRNPSVTITNYSSRVSLINCFIFESNNNGIKINAGSHHNLISGCTVVKGGSNDGITCHDVGEAEPGDHNVIENNVVGLWPENSLDITGGDYQVCRGNICYNDGESNITIGHGADHILIQNNILMGAVKSGINIGVTPSEGGRGHNMIYQNLIYSCLYPGIENQANNTRIYNNTIVDARDRATIRIDSDGTEPVIRNNLLVNMDPTINESSLRFQLTDPSSLNASLDHNAFYNVSVGEAVMSAWTGSHHDTYTLAQFLATYGTGADSFTAVPRFDPASIAGFLRHYLLAPASPCVDTGVDVGLPYSGAAPDIGWKERGAWAEAPIYPRYLIQGSDDVTAILYVWGKLGPVAPVSPENFDHFNVRLGTQTFAPKYDFSPTEDRLVETARRIHEMGSDVIKIQMASNVFADYGLPPFESQGIFSLRDLADKQPSYHHVFDMPFKHYMVWAYCHTAPWIRWRDGLSQSEAVAEAAEIYEFASYLLEHFSGTGKSFYLGHWEGDWTLLGHTDRDLDPTPTAIQGMIDWLNVRQAAVERARANTPHNDVNVYHYAEVNLVDKALNGGVTVTNDVLPHVTLDLVSYSAWDTTVRINSTPTFLAALDLIRAKSNTMGHFYRDVFVGEYGFPLDDGARTPEEQASESERIFKAALNWGCPFALYWQMYDAAADEGGANARGLWLIDNQDVKQPVWYKHNTFLGRAHVFKNLYRFWLRRNPDEPAFSNFSNAYLVDLSLRLDSLLNSNEYAQILGDAEFVVFLFETLFGVQNPSADPDFAVAVSALGSGTPRSELLDAALDGTRFEAVFDDASFAHYLVYHTLRNLPYHTLRNLPDDPDAETLRQTFETRLLGGEDRSTLWRECLDLDEFARVDLAIRQVDEKDSPMVFRKYFFDLSLYNPPAVPRYRMHGSRRTRTRQSGVIPVITRHPESVTVSEGSPIGFGVTATGSAPLTVLPPGVPPVITRHPESATVSAGSPIGFSVTATGSAPLSYQWYVNGVPPPSEYGGNAASVSAPTSLVGWSGYRLHCVVSNAYGSAVSASVTLTVNP